MRRITFLWLTLASLLPTLTACGPDVARWQEEVLLHDGRMITIERMAKAEPSGFPNANRGRDLEFQITYEPMGVHWVNTKGDQQLAFEVFDGVPYLVITVPSERSFCRGKPDTAFPVRVFKMQGTDWVEVSHELFLFGVANKNLYRGYWGNKASEDAIGLITWKYKEEHSVPGYPIAGESPEERLKFIRRPYKLSEFFNQQSYICGNFR